MFSQYKELPRSVFVIAFARFFTALGAFIYPFLILYFTNTHPVSEDLMGIYIFVVSFSNIPAALLGGKLADLYPPKLVYITLITIASFLYFLCAALFYWKYFYYLLTLTFFVMSSVIPVISTLMVHHTKMVERPSAFSLLYLTLNIGFSIGPFFTALVFHSCSMLIFLMMGAGNLTSMIVVKLLLPESVPGQAKDCQQSNPLNSLMRNERSLFFIIRKEPYWIVFFLLTSVVAFSFTQVTFLLPLQFEETFGKVAGTHLYSILTLINGCVLILLTAPVIQRTQKNKPMKNMGVASLLYGFAFLIYAFSASLLALYGGILIWSTAQILGATYTGVFIANRSPISHRGRFQSLYDIIQGIGRSTGAFVMGAYLTGHTISQGWIMTMLLCFSVSLAFFLFHRALEHKERANNLSDKT